MVFMIAGVIRIGLPHFPSRNVGIDGRQDVANRVRRSLTQRHVPYQSVTVHDVDTVQRGVLNEGLLNRMHRASAGDAFDGDDVLALGLDGQHEA